MKLVEHYIMRGTRRLVLIIVGFLIFIFASYSAQRYLTEVMRRAINALYLVR